MGRTPDETLETLGGRKKLSEAELEFMNVIWEHSEGISSEDLYACFGQAREQRVLCFTGSRRKIMCARSGKGSITGILLW